HPPPALYTLSLHDALPIYRCDRKQTLLAGTLAFVVVDELERTFTQIHDCHIRGRADVERAAIVERGEHTRGIDGCASNDLGQRQDRKSTRLNSSHDQISYA